MKMKEKSNNQINNKIENSEESFLNILKSTGEDSVPYNKQTKKESIN